MTLKKKVKVTEECCGGCKPKQSNGGCGSAVYSIGIAGAVFYFFQNAQSFSDYLMGILKAFAWPAILVYKALELLKF